MAPLELPDPYAEASDLAQYWRSLSTGEQTKATYLLKWAAKRIQELPGHEDFDRVVAAEVSMIMVKRAMIATANDREGVTDITSNQSMADMSASSTQKFANPLGALYLTPGEKDRLAGREGQRGGSLTLSSNVRIPPEPWNNQPSSQIEASTDVGP